MVTLLHRAQSDAKEAINELAGITRTLNAREAQERHTVIWWLLYDMYQRARVAPLRIEAEQQLRMLVGQKSTLGDLRRYSALCEKIRSGVEGVEIQYARTDLLQLPSIAGQGIEALRTLVEGYNLEGTPLWLPMLGVGREKAGAQETRAEIGKQSALGAFAVIVSALVKGRHDLLVAKIAEAVFGGNILGKDVAYYREVFLMQRGFR
jgi:hypothetical protein